MIRLPLFFILLLAAPDLAAQALRIEYFTVNDGLSTRDVNDLHIGADGYLWVATMDGLNRFDGHTFLSFGQGASSDTRLSRGAIESIRADNERKLVLTFKDFYGYFDRFDPRSFEVERVKMLPSTGVVGYPRAIETDHLGRTFVVTIGPEGTIIYEYTPTGFQVLYEEPNDEWLTFAPRLELLPLSNGQFLVYDEQYGFRHLSATGKLLGKFYDNQRPQRRLYTMAEARDGHVYLSFRDGYPLFRWHPDQDAEEPEPVPKLDAGLHYTQMFRDEHGQLLLAATEDILGQRHPDEYYLVDTLGEFYLFERNLPTDRLVSAMAAIDFGETLYLGLRDGLGVMERYINPVRAYLTNTGDDLYRQAVRGVAEDARGRVYVLTDNGALYYLDEDDQLLGVLPLVRADSTEVSLREARQLLYDPQAGVIWGLGQPTGVNLKGGLLFRYDPVTGYTTTYSSNYTLTCIAVGPDGNLYLGASDPKEVGLLLRFDRDGKRFSKVIGLDAAGTQVQRLRINYLASSRGGRLLIGTKNRGLVTYNPGNVGRMEFFEDAEAEFDASTVNVIYEDTAGNWWLGTDGGLHRLSPSDGSVRRYGRQDGLSSNTVVGIVPDSTGGFWISTNNGLVHVPADRDKGTFRRYYQEDGLTNDEFSRFAFLRDRSGRYFFGGDNGLTVFRDGDLSSESAGSDVMLTQIVAYGRGEARTLTRNLDKLRELKVSAHEKSLAVSFALPVGQRPSSSQFRVKLEGFNDEWRELRNERTVRYNNLPAGNYRLLVQGAGANGNFGDGMLELDIDVRQYLYEKFWFQLLIAAIIIVLFVWIIQAKLRERLRNEQLRTQLSSDIHDEVSGLLAGITLQAELLKSKTDDEVLQNRLHTVGEAGRNAMSKMSDVIWSIDSRRDTIGNLLQRMQEHADEVLLPLDVRYDFRATGFDKEKELPGNIRQDIYFIYKEAINNIARHSSATRVEIELEQFAQTFEMFIRDNGKANGTLRVSKPGQFTPKSGQGKDNMRMRAHRLKGSLTIDDRAGYTLILRMKRLA